MARYRLFISAVSSEFEQGRDQLAASLRAREMDIAVQSDFHQHDDTTLHKLHDYIRHQGELARNWLRCQDEQRPERTLAMAKMLDNGILDAVPDHATRSVAPAWANGATTVHHFGDIAGKGVFAALSDPAIFAQVHVGERGRSLEWPGEFDFCADALWFEAHPEDGPPPREAGAQPIEHTAP